MKRSMITLAFAAFAVSGLAHAADTVSSGGEAASNVQTQQWSPSRDSIAPKSRAQVRQELVQAEQDGQLADLNRTVYRGGM
jgi:TolA-binding protein